MYCQSHVLYAMKGVQRSINKAQSLFCLKEQQRTRISSTSVGQILLGKRGSKAAAIPTHSHNYLELCNGCGGQVRPSRQLYIFPFDIIDLGEILVNHIVIDQLQFRRLPLSAIARSQSFPKPKNGACKHRRKDMEERSPTFGFLSLSNRMALQPCITNKLSKTFKDCY